jgi:putative sterol carrier protein
LNEVTILGEDLSGLGWTLKSLIDANLAKPEILVQIRRVKGSLVVCETGANVAVTIFFNNGNIQIQDQAIQSPSARLSANFDGLAEVAGGNIGPVMALLTGKIKAGGNLFKLLKMSKAIISRE